MIYYSAYRYKDDEVSRMNVDQEYMQVNCVGSYQLEEEDYCITQRKRGRKDFLLIYTHTGRSMVRFGAEEQEAAAGTAYLYRPGEEQFYGQIRNICTKCYWVCFSGYGVNALLDDLEIPTREILDIGADRWLPVTFESMISAVMKKTAHYEIHTAILMQQLLYKVSELLASRAGRNEPEISECVGTSINYMNLNYQKKIMIKELAENSGLSVSRFIQIFREAAGAAPKEYLMNIRLEKACEFLRYTNLTVKEIAAMCGFEDQLYFSRVFRKYRKLSPTEYRKMWGEQDTD